MRRAATLAFALAACLGLARAQDLESGKNPGLGLRGLHAAGIDGRGVGVAIIDQALNKTHREYADRLAFYEDIGDFFDGPQMHGPAVASLAVGRDVGVAPGATLYFVSTWLFHKECVRASGFSKCPITYRYYAQALDRLVALNRTLPEGAKIRVASISRGFDREDEGYDEMTASLRRAKDAGIFVVTTSLAKPAEYGWAFHGLGRPAGADPDDPQSYVPDAWESEESVFDPAPKLFVPIDGRTYASRRADDAYEFGASGGWSWAAPYIAGLYALACQVKTTVTPEEFWKAALATGARKTMSVRGHDRVLATIVDPPRLIERLKTGN